MTPPACDSFRASASLSPMSSAGSKAASSLLRLPAETCKFIGPRETSSFAEAFSTPLAESRTTTHASKDKKAHNRRYKAGYRHPHDPTRPEAVETSPSPKGTWHGAREGKRPK